MTKQKRVYGSLKHDSYNTFRQARNQREFRATQDVIKEIYKAGMFVTSGNSGKYMEVHEYFMGKPRHVAQLGNFMRDKAGRNVYKDGNPRNCTKRNVTSKTQLKLF